MFRSDAKARHDQMVDLVEMMPKLHKNLPRPRRRMSRRPSSATDK
jgi:hypothetical protein